MWYFANGDAGFYFAEQLKQMSWLPAPWHPEFGFGLSTLSRMWFDYPYLLFIKIFSSAGFSWWLIDKILWIIVFAVGIYSSFRIAKHVLRDVTSAVLASVIYIANTYFLLLFSGGQLGVALGFAFSPLVFLKFVKAIDASFDSGRVTDNQPVAIRDAIINGLYLAALIAFDLRLAYLLCIGIVMYFGYRVIYAGLKKITFYRLLSDVQNFFIIPLAVSAGIHMFWILPTVLASGGISDLGEQFTNPGMLKFLSVADFPHTLSFLHPNWPENLFGKVYFLQPEFLIIPLIAYISLLFIKEKTKKSPHIVFFAFLPLIGAFFAKGVQEPLGGIFQWMFVHVPGFVMFRDPTKFYMFTAIGYSILIPFSLGQLARKYTVFKHKTYQIFVVAFVIFWCFTIRAVFSGETKGNFRPLQSTAEYVRLKDMLVADLTPSRTVWMPQKDAFVYMSEDHPLLKMSDLFGDASMSAIIDMTKKTDFINRLNESGVGYVIVPADLEKRIFLSDYSFNPEERNLLIRSLKQTSLTQDNSFIGITVFKNDHFIMTSKTPAVVAKQQTMANIGLLIGIFTTLAGVGIIIY